MADMFATVNEGDQTDHEFSVTEAVLPVQFYGARRGAATIEPLRRLMIAMLVDAVRCFQTKFGARQQARRQEFEEVRSWIFSDKDNGPFSFTAVCDALEIDPKAIRKGLVRWEEKTLSGEQPRMTIRRSPVPLAMRISRWPSRRFRGRQ
jgi:hypothetical protein